MRRLIALLGVVVLLLAGCSAQEEDGIPQVTQIGFCIPQEATVEAGSFWHRLQQDLERQGYYVVCAGAQKDQSRQLEQIRDFRKQGMALVVVEPVMADAVQELSRVLESAAMPAVLVGQAPEASAMGKKMCYVGSTDTDAGALQAQIILDLMNRGDVNGDGTVAYGVLAGPEDHSLTGRLLEHCTGTMTQMESVLLRQYYGDYSQSSGKQLCEQLLSEFGRDVEVLFCHSDDMAMGALEALQAAGRTVGTDVFVVGCGGTADALTAIRDGQLTGTVCADVKALADQVQQHIKALLAGEAVETMYYVNHISVTRSNAAALLP